MLIDFEFDQFKNEFKDESNIEIYGSCISKIVNILVDWSINETFNKNAEFKSCKSAIDLIALTNYMFKSIKLRYLIQLGLKQTHIQYLILNFTKFPSVSLVIESISANLKDSSHLFSLEKNDPTYIIDDDEINYRITLNKIYEATIKSCDLVFQNNMKTKRSKYLIIKTHENLSKFLNDKILKQSETNQNVNMAKLKKLTSWVIKTNLKKMKRSLNKTNIMKDVSIKNSARYLKIIIVKLFFYDLILKILNLRL